MNTVYWVLVAFGIVVLEARLHARNVRYLPILPAIVLGAVLSKVTYVVLQWHYAFPHWGWGAFTVLRPDTFCFFGGAVGVVLGVIISAKLTHQRVLPVLDAFAPAGALLVAIARFGEKYLGEIGTAGFEMPEQLAFFPFALTNEWGESYPAIFMLSCLAALIVAIVGLTRKPGGRDGQLFLRTAFYLALPQIMCESLLAECMKWGFVRVQQLLCALTLLVILIVECRRAAGSLSFAKRWWPVGALLLCAAGLVGVEFALDKSGLPAFVGYGAMVVLLALIAGLSINGAFAALFSSIVPFSVFPILSLLLTVYCLHQRYQNRSMPVGLPGLAAAFFILGVLLYSTVVRAEYPDIGSNFFPAVLSVAMVFWIGYKMRNRKDTAAE